MKNEIQGQIQQVHKNSIGNITGVEIQGEDNKHYYSHVGDFKEIEKEIYKIRDKIQNNIREGSKVTFQPFKNDREGGRATSVNILDLDTN